MLMSAFRDKSNINFTAADTLQKQHNLYDPSIHCSYYACVQEMLHIIFTKLGKTQEEFDKERYDNGKGTHVWASKLITSELGRKDWQEYKYFQKHFPELKKLREKADYSERKGGRDDSAEAYRLSTTLVNQIKQLFK